MNKYPLSPYDQKSKFGTANKLSDEGGIFSEEESEGARFSYDAEEAATAPEAKTPVRATSAGRDEKPVRATSGSKSPSSPSKAPLKAALVILLTALGLAVALGVVYFSTHVVVGDLFGEHEIYSANVTEVDLSGSRYDDYSQLSRLSSMEKLVLTDSSFDDFSVLDGCNSLRRVVLTGRLVDAEDCVAFYGRHPGALIECSIDIDGRVIDSTTESLVLDNAADDVQRKAAAFGRLRTLDLTGSTVSYQTYIYLRDRLPDCRILVNVRINGQTYSSDATRITLTGEVTAEDLNQMQFLSGLQVVDAVNCTNTTVLDEIAGQHPGVRFNTSMKFLGKSIGSEDELIDLRGMKFSLVQLRAELDEKLGSLRSLKKIDMCGCGFSNAEMEQLTVDYPGVKFVWIIHVRAWNVRTDAVVFSCLNSNGREVGTETDYAPIWKYCTDLRAIDMGHSKITSLRGLENLKKLRAAIFTDNELRDVEPFAQLPDLEFIEINVNRIQSAEPMRNLQHLKYINFYSSKHMTDLSPLYNHKELRIALLHHTVPQDERERFAESNPDCSVSYTVTPGYSTNEEWRGNPYRQALKKAFTNWKIVVGFDDETGEYIFDPDTDQYKYR